MSAYSIAYLILGIVVCAGIRIAQPNERIAIYRLGRYVGIRAGLTWIIPFIDRTVRINLDNAVPVWRSLQPDDLTADLEEWLRRNVRGGPPAA